MRSEGIRAHTRACALPEEEKGMQMPDAMTQWKGLWAQWYLNRQQRDEINAALVQAKGEVRATGTNPRQPSERELEAEITALKPKK